MVTSATFSAFFRKFIYSLFVSDIKEGTICGEGWDLEARYTSFQAENT